MRTPLRFFGSLSAALLLAAMPVWSCINTFESELLYSLEQGDAAAAGEMRRLEQTHAASPTLENSNDLGVALLLSGRIDEAIKLFRATEMKFPDNARVAANLGSALELKGEHEEALKWIHEGVMRDVTGHKGSEWLHERILKAKIALPRDPRWFDKESVLMLDFGSGDVPVAPGILSFEKGKLKGAEELLLQADYQLQERSKFTKPPDAIMGDLYASAGDLVIASGLSLLDGGIEDAKRFYESSLTYGAPHADRIRKRLARYEADLAAMPPRPPRETTQDDVVDYPVIERSRATGLTLWISVAAAIALCIGGFVAFRIRRKRKAAQV